MLIMPCRIACHGILNVLLLLLVVGPACAGGPSVASVNGQLQGLYGQTDGDELKAGGASLALPLGSPFGLQLDGAYGGIDEDQLKGVGLHLFSRDPERYLLGLLAAHAELQDIDLNRLGIEGELFAGPITLSALAGHQQGDVDNTTFGAIDLRWYPGDNLLLLIGGHLADGVNNKMHFGVEYQMLAGLSVFVDLAAGENNYDHALVGLRYYFGGRKDLIRRHRQDTMANPIVTNVLQGLGSIREEQRRLANRGPVRK